MFDARKSAKIYIYFNHFVVYKLYHVLPLLLYSELGGSLKFISKVQKMFQVHFPGRANSITVYKCTLQVAP